jgi:hypothetical protein
VAWYRLENDSDRNDYVICAGLPIGLTGTSSRGADLVGRDARLQQGDRPEGMRATPTQRCAPITNL